ncbi:MAG: response regulator [Desulfobacterales bacterium]|nr:response regulator [Desulfobacterales bacterium]
MKRILAIEDDPGLRGLYEAIAEKIKCSIDTAATGEAGLALIEGNRYDMIFLDLRLPGYDGVEILQIIGRKFPETPVYVVTGFYEEYFERLRELNRQGIFFELLRKPFRNAEIVEIIQSVLGESS